MNRRARFLASIIGPPILGLLKVQTKLTGRERARVVIVDESQEILLVHELVGNRWSLPGGGIEKGEMPFEAAAREVYEETGVQVAPEELTLLGIVRRPEVKIGYVGHIFLLKTHKGRFKAAAHRRHELLDIAWFPLSALPSGMSAVSQAALALLSKK